MRCKRCNAETATGLTACVACGAPSVVGCPQCGVEAPPGFKFCGDCGASLARAAPEIVAPLGASEAERRQLTVVFCDLVGSTALSERLDPEDLREVLREYQATCAAVVSRFDGQVAQYLGDGILVYFGFPRAHEDDPQRAVRASIEILADTARLSARLEVERSVTLAVRIGIHTGLVVAGEMGSDGRRETLAIGETPNIAARIQALAEPNAILISAATHGLAHGYFNCHSLGTHALKGVSKHMVVFQVIGEIDEQTRIDVAESAMRTALIGRDDELVRLGAHWQEASRGSGRVVLLSGEAGMGKSRLIHAFGRLTDGVAIARLRYFCSERHTNSPLYPVIRHITAAAGIELDDLAATRFGKLQALLAASAPSTEELELLCAVLSIPDGSNQSAQLDLTPQQIRQKTLAALLRQVEHLATRGPVVVLFEDVHWIDPTSRELLDAMIARVPELPVLAIVTFRPEFQANWVLGPHLDHLPMGRLNDADRKTLIERIANDVRLPDMTVREIAERSDGVPIYVEELTRAVLEAQSDMPDARSAAATGSKAAAVPQTLQSSLLARLDRLGTTAKEVAQIGAVIGREFYFRLLAAVARKTEVELMAALEALAGASLLTFRGKPPEATYVFRHALLQDAAYATLLRGRRRELHAAIAKEIDVRHWGGTASHELLAHHCSEAGMHREAVRALRSAARQSVDHGFFAEARAQLNAGLATVQILPMGVDRDRQEVAVQNALGNVLIAERGYTAPETQAAFERARVLAAGLDDPGQGLRALWGLGSGLLFAGRLGALLERLHEAAPLVEKNGHLDARLAFSVMQGSVLLDLGRLLDARQQLEKTLEIDTDPGRDRERAILYGQSPRILALGCLSIASLLINHPEKSREQSIASIREAEKLLHKPMLCLAYSFACRRDWLAMAKEDLVRNAAVMQRLAEEQATPLWLALSKTYLGWALAEESQPEQGIALMREGLGEYQASGASSAVPLMKLAFGRACVRSGRGEEALEAFGEALRGGLAGEERWIEAEVHRELGETLAGGQNAGAAEDALRRSVAVAGQQGARLFELRGATGLGRLLLAQSRKRDAFDLLNPLDGVDAPPEFTVVLKAAAS